MQLMRRVVIQRMHRGAARLILLALVCTTSVLLGCSGGVTLRSSDGQTKLTYHCDSIVPQASSPAERQLIGNEALRLSAEAKRSVDPSRVLFLADAQVESGPTGVEIAVVESLCEDLGRLPDRETPSMPLVFPATGATAPQFEAPLVDRSFLQGRERSLVSLDGLQDSVVVLYFWASWCAPCVAHLAELGQLARDYQSRGVAFYGVLSEETAPAQALELLEENNAIELTPILDENRNISQAYGTFGVPWMFVLDRTGKLVGRCTGCDYTGWDDAGVRIRLDSLLEES